MKNTKYLLALTMVALPLYGQGIHENFDQVAPNTTLSAKTVEGWRQEGPAPAGSAVITEEAGYLSGKGLRLEKRDTMAVYESGGPIWSSTNGAFTFKITFRFSGKILFDVALHNGSTSAGFYISINARTGELSASQGGGESAFRGNAGKYPVKELRKETWYTLEIRNITLHTTLAEPTSGKLYLYEAANSADLILDGISVAASGSIPLSSIKTVLIRRWGEGVLDIDDIKIGAASDK